AFIQPAFGITLFCIEDRSTGDNPQTVNRFAVDAELYTAIALFSVNAKNSQTIRVGGIHRDGISTWLVNLEQRQRGVEPAQIHLATNFILCGFEGGEDFPRIDQII